MIEGRCIKEIEGETHNGGDEWCFKVTRVI